MTKDIILKIENLNFYYGVTQILHSINLDIEKNNVHSIMGPSGCGKSTLLRCLNRISETSDISTLTKGSILFEGRNILGMQSIEVRQKIGMVFQKPTPFPHMSIYENVVSGYVFNNVKLKSHEKDEIVETTLKSIGLWEEVKNNLKKRGTFLSGGQQQRLCIARALALKPHILLLDEPTSALDPFATEAVENLLGQLKNEVSIVIVTHNIAQAKRISDNCTFMYLGSVVESARAKELFEAPKNEKTRNFLKGVFG